MNLMPPHRFHEVLGFFPDLCSDLVRIVVRAQVLHNVPEVAADVLPVNSPSQRPQRSRLCISRVADSLIIELALDLLDQHAEVVPGIGS